LREAVRRAILLLSRDGGVADQDKGHFSQKKVRERVERVMDAWPSYPDFAHLFAALIEANGTSAAAFAQTASTVIRSTQARRALAAGLWNSVIAF
jgi:hypothetical protein